MYATPRHKVFISFHHADQVYKEYLALMMEHFRGHIGSGRTLLANP